MNYQVILARSVQKQLLELPDAIRDRVTNMLEELERNPRPTNVKKLKGREAWRVRVGDYRVIYEVHDPERRLIVITIAHRRDVYR